MRADEEQRKGFQWSYSASRQLTECPRQFHLSHDYRRGTGSPSVSVHALVGLAVHEAVSAEVSAWASGQIVSKMRAQEHASQYLKGIWNRRGQRVTEFANHLPEGAAPDLPYLLKAARVRLGRFFEMIWPTFSDCDYQSHEQLAIIPLSGTPVAVKVDFACWTKSRELLIVDWKTGGSGNVAAGRMQLAVYALWAHRALGVEMNKIRPVLVSLATGERIEFAPTQMDLDGVEGLIAEDLTKIQEMRAVGEFPARPNFDLCLACRFLSNCPEGSAAVASVYRSG